MALTLTYTGSLSGVETVADTFASSNDNTVTLNGMAATGTLNSGSGVPVTKQAAGEITMSSGTGSLDLRALAGGVGGATVDGNGLKVQAIMLKNKATNSNDITLAEGASNGHPTFGASFTFKLKVGQWCLFFLNETGTDIATADKVIDITGTGSEVLQYHVVMG